MYWSEINFKGTQHFHVDNVKFGYIASAVDESYLSGTRFIYFSNVILLLYSSDCRLKYS